MTGTALVFYGVGIGSWDTATGEYLVYNADGTPKKVASPLGGPDTAEKLLDVRAAMDRAFPELDLHWLHTADGEDCVCLIQAARLLSWRDQGGVRRV